MKKIFIIALIACFSQAHALTTVLMETSTHVGFAPPQYSGIFKVQVLSDGTLQKIDNKQKTTKFAKLSSAAVKNLSQQIANLEVNDLQGEDGPMCADAPMKKVKVIKNSEEIVIKTNISCLTKEMLSAYSLIRIAESVENLSSSLTK